MNGLTFAVEPRPGTKHQRFLDHVHDNLCNGDEARYTYVLSWMARAIQAPDLPGEIAIVLCGRKGSGKSLFAKIFGALFGKHYWQGSARNIVGNFNAYLRDCVLLFVDEAFTDDKKHANVIKTLIKTLLTDNKIIIERKGFDTEMVQNRVHLIMTVNEQWAIPAIYAPRFLDDKTHTHILKTLITEDKIIVERKGFDAEVMQNCVRLIVASNEQWIIPASYEQRFLVLDVTAPHRQGVAYFGAIDADMKSGGLSNLLDELQALDISAFNHHAMPQHERRPP